MCKNDQWHEIATDYLNTIISTPSKFDLPTWRRLEELTKKSKVTLWRDKLIYDLYQQARISKRESILNSCAGKSKYRRSLEDRITYLELELRKANQIIDAHIVMNRDVFIALQRLNIDPLLVMTDIADIELQD
ncbi:hypothetical protein TMS3_0103970 [Pseudomonas taeanensis MS-3]|uniref:Uncharacterized protein n=1 Tax=Pseudomonas taeanensis MS-3 TaxID=1395571 RepID=A0A0A1YQH3_9PSED|nr:hypothetical protein [Pseudomonas taeanensis]KFX71104.1 hypothetical protein TMS3_0103970 [Pseudomonas taeanensis MS-3]